MSVDTFDKYETKRTGLSCDEALEATVLGYRVRCKSLQAEAYIHYVGEGWRIQFVHDGQDRSSSAWSPTQYHWLEQWQIVPLPSEVKRDSWGRPIVGDRHEEVQALIDSAVPIERIERTWDDVMSDKERTEGGSRDKPTKDKWGQ